MFPTRWVSTPEVKLGSKHNCNFGWQDALCVRPSLASDLMPDGDQVAAAHPLCAAANAPKGLKEPARGRWTIRFVLDDASDEALLATRLCDLPIALEGTLMERRVKRLHRELQARNISALPHTWLSEEFFNPDGVLGFAIPFYLAHPRLMRLERNQMLEVEGAGEAECRRIFPMKLGTPSTMHTSCMAEQDIAPCLVIRTLPTQRPTSRIPRAAPTSST